MISCFETIQPRLDWLSETTHANLQQKNKFQPQKGRNLEKPTRKKSWTWQPCSIRVLSTEMASIPNQQDCVVRFQEMFMQTLAFLEEIISFESFHLVSNRRFGVGLRTPVVGGKPACCQPVGERNWGDRRLRLG